MTFSTSTLAGQYRKRHERRLRGHTETIGERFERNRAAMLPLPAAPYEACEKASTRVKSYGCAVTSRKRKRGKRRRQDNAEGHQAVYANRRRVRGNYCKNLLRRRGELVEHSFVHCYETGGMRCCHLRGRENMLKRQSARFSGFNLSLVMRQLLGAGISREPKNKATALAFRII